MQSDWPSIDLTSLLNILAKERVNERIPFDDKNLEASLELTGNNLNVTVHPPLHAKQSLYALVGSEVYELVEKKGKYRWQLPKTPPKTLEDQSKERWYLVVVE